MIWDIWRCDGRETLPLMPMSGRPLFMVMHAIPEVLMCGWPLACGTQEGDAEANRDLFMWYCPRYHHWVASVEKIVSDMRDNPKSVHYEDLNKVCEHYFGPPRTTGGSHAVFKTPWPGDPRVNIQNDKGRAMTYQVRQVLAAIDQKEAL